MRTKAATGVAVLAGLALAGCTSVRPDADFDVVREQVRERTGVQPQWNALRPEDAQVEERSRELLARELTVDAAVELALLNNRRLQAAYEEIGVARADLVQAGLLVNPVLSADLTFGVSGPGQGVAIGLVQNFMRALQIPLRKRVAEAALEEAKFAVAAQVIDLVVEVRRAFVRAQGAEQLVELDQRIADATRLSTEVAQQQRTAGNITDLDLANEVALFEDARVRLAVNEAEATVAREDLTALMGLWGPLAAWTIMKRLPDPLDDLPVDGLESLAVSQRADLAAARQATEALNQALGLTGLYGVMSDAEFGPEVERDLDSGIWSVGPLLSIPIPIFDQGQATRASALARLRQSQERFTALAVEIRSQVRRAHARLQAMHALASHYRRVVLPLRSRIVDQTQLQYNAMQVGVFQLLQARQAQIDAARAYLEVVKDYWLARADLEGAVGGAFPEAAPTAAASATTTPALAPRDTAAAGLVAPDSGAVTRRPSDIKAEPAAVHQGDHS
ncbi:MAG: TolC family protein [bacterium]